MSHIVILPSNGYFSQEEKNKPESKEFFSSFPAKVIPSNEKENFVQPRGQKLTLKKKRRSPEKPYSLGKLGQISWFCA